MTTLPCPSCGSQTIVKNGLIHNGKQNHKCKDCGRQFVEDPQQKRINPQTTVLIDLRKYPWLVPSGFVMYQKAGYKSMGTANMQQSLKP